MTVGDYCLFSDVQQMLFNVDLSGSAGNGQPYSTVFAPLITRASRIVDQDTNRKPGAYAVGADTTYTFDGVGQNVYSPAYGGYYQDRLTSGGGTYSQLWIGELAQAPTSIGVAMTGDTTQYTNWPATNASGKPNYYLWPYNATDFSQPYRRIDLNIIYGDYRTWYGFKNCVQIVGRFGFSLTPPYDIIQATINRVARLFKRGEMGFQDRLSYSDGNNTQMAYMSKLDADYEDMIMNYRRQAI